MRIMYVMMVYRSVLVLMPGYVSSNNSVLEIGLTKIFGAFYQIYQVPRVEEKLEMCLFKTYFMPCQGAKIISSV